jgi:hypothetical protein
MIVKIVRESLNFKKGGDPYDTLQIGKFGLRRALLSQEIPKEDITGQYPMKLWMDKLPARFRIDLEYDRNSPDDFKNYTGLDEDYYLENELPEGVNEDEFRNEWKPSSPKKTDNSKGFPIIWGEGKINGGFKVIKYEYGMGSGYLAKREWLKKDI